MPPGGDDRATEFNIAHELGQLTEQIKQAIKRLDDGSDRFADIDDKLTRHKSADERLGRAVGKMAEEMAAQSRRLGAIERRLGMRAGDNGIRQRPVWNWWMRKLRALAATVLTLLTLGVVGWMVRVVFHINLQPIIDSMTTPGVP